MNKFCNKCGTYYNSQYEVDHVYECYGEVTYRSNGTASYRLTLPGVYKLTKLNAIDPNRAKHKLAQYGLGKSK